MSKKLKKNYKRRSSQKRVETNRINKKIKEEKEMKKMYELMRKYNV